MSPRTLTPRPRLNPNPFCLYAVVVLCIGCGKTGVLPSSPIVAMVDEDSISRDEFRAAFMEAKIDGAIDENSESVKELKRNLLNELIEQHLFLTEAGKLKLDVGPDELQQAVDRIKGDYAAGEFEAMIQKQQTTFEQWKERLRKELLSQKVINQAVPQIIQIPEAEVQSYYKQHPKDFIHPAEVRARQIVVANEETAKSLRLQLTQGADFASLAKTHSLSPDKEQGGDLGFFTKGDMPEEFDIVFSLEVGKISPIVKTAYGYHLFKVEERHPEKSMTPSEAAERIRAQLTQERREQSFAAWVARLKEKARITVNYQILYQPLGSVNSPPEPVHE
ncbi:MAG TPA: peptidyl-prolyl cis-trans isomerase [Nitrospiria bacterium]|nr:peptidyl-prolyl cis-trans isomerase [Nitrospiria bacterium]